MTVSQEYRELENQLEKAWQLFVEGRLDEALNAFQSVLSIDPDSPMANSVAGACLLRLGHFEEAEQYGRSGVHLAPRVALAHLFLAEALSANEKYEDAESEYWEAVALNPNAPGAHLALGRFLLSRDRHPEARVAFEKAITASPEDADAHYLIAICHFRDGATKEAMNAIDLAIRFAPGSDIVWHFRGLVLMSLAKDLKRKEKVAVFRDASESLRKAVELNSSNAEARDHLTMVYNAITAIEQYLDSVTELKRGWWQIALCVAGVMIFAILDRSFWINALIILVASSALAAWRNRRRIARLGPDPFESIHPLQLSASFAGLQAIADAPVVNEWLN